MKDTDQTQTAQSRMPEEFRRRMRALLGEDYGAFEAAYREPLRRGLRVNTLKCGREQLLSAMGKPMSPVPFAADGFYLQGEHRAGADPLHHAGAYYMQEPSAMAAVTVLRPRPGERILDLCAAPGGKSTQIAAAMAGKGILWANEYVRSRARVLAQNIERCGVRNAAVSSADAGALCGALSGWFDAVLVDAPCSGEGMFRKEPAALEQWGMDNISLCAARQTQLLDAAALAVRPGGRLVYSTCTFAPEENELQVMRFLNDHPDFVPEECGAAFGRPGLPPERLYGFDDGKELVNGARYTPDACRRIFPGDGGEGHFIALLRKRDGRESSVPEYVYPNNTFSKEIIKLYKECFRVAPYGVPCVVGGQVRLLPEGLPALQGLGVLTAGVAAAEICRGRLEPAHALFMAANSAADCLSAVDLPPEDPRAAAFLRGMPIEAPGLSGWSAAAVCGVVCGFGKASGGVLKNRYPKGLRLLG